VVPAKQNTRSSVSIRQLSDLIHNGSAADPRVIRELSAAFAQLLHRRFHRFSTEFPQVFREFSTRAARALFRSFFLLDSEGVQQTRPEGKWAKDRRWTKTVEKRAAALHVEHLHQIGGGEADLSAHHH
jgi:hypothetical protein